MDSLHFPWLCFLLLTLAALGPNIAMPSDNHAEETRDKTQVTVYHCKDRKSKVCSQSKEYGYEECKIIVETQEETFSNEEIRLNTIETRITMCFQQENAFSEGVYAIVWQKQEAVGESCIALTSEAFSGNVGGSITKNCCVAEINLSVPKSPLKCYTKMFNEKTVKSAPDITGEENLGNTHFLTGKKSNIGIITSVLFLGVCAAALATYAVLRNRNARGSVIVVHHHFNAFRRNQMGS